MTFDGGISGLSLAELSREIKKRSISPVEVVTEILDRIRREDGKLNSHITVLEDEALSSARQAEKEIMSGDYRGPLHGVPIGLKDIIFTKGIRTTMGSALFEDFVPNCDATVVEKLERAGAVFTGKLNTHEFAYGPTGDRSFFGAIRNPHDFDTISGGSSGGSAAAVASLLCYAALGSDTGGSIRIPASCCGVVGMKPTFGRVSKRGVFPLAWTLDHAGPITRTVEDNAIVLNAISGYDARDPHSVQSETEDFAHRLSESVGGSVVGVPSNFYFENLDAEVGEKVRHALDAVDDAGAELRPIEIPHLEEVLLAQQTTIKVEAYAAHKERVEKHGEHIDEEVKDRLLGGEATRAYEYARAQEVRRAGIRAFEKVFEEVDVLVAPTLPILPTEIDQRVVSIRGEKEHVRSALTRLTGPTNLTGLPSLSLPCGLSSAGLPIGLQIMGKPFDEANIYGFGHIIEKALRC